MMAQTEKAYKAGSKCPPLKSGQLRLYSMRFCPYAQRARLILRHYNLPHEIVNVNLREKPDWFSEKNPDGAVPVLECDRGVLTESSVCAEYLDEAYGKCRLSSADPFEKARRKMLALKFEKFTGLYYSAIGWKDGDEPKDAEGRFRHVLEPFEAALRGKYFGGDAPSLLDFFVWPWFERLPVLKKLHNLDVLGSGLPKLRAWVETMGDQPAVAACRVPDDQHVEFIRQYFDPSLPYPDYDMGLG